MEKHFCDHCGREITDELSLRLHLFIMKGNTNMRNIKKEYCNKCFKEAIRNFEEFDE